MKKVFAFIERGPMQIVISTIAVFLLSVTVVGATTTISTNIVTGGDATVTGNVYASSTVQGTNLVDWGNSALKGTVSVTGVATFAAGAFASTTLQGAAITDYGALSVTGTATHSGATTLTGTTTLAQSLVMSDADSISCIQFFATSSATAVKLLFYATTSVASTNGIGTLNYAYGTCN